MTEKQLKLLGFKREEIKDYEDEIDPDYYYAYDIVNGFTFITRSKQELVGDDWYVEVFNTDPAIRFYGFEEVQVLINKFTSAIVK